MSINKFLIFGIILFSCFSCGTDDGIELGKLGEDYLVFGHFYGECGGEGCVENFALTENKLYEDTNDNYGSTDFNFVELESDKYEKVKDLEDFFPSQLLNEKETTFGCPDCGDWGGLLVQYGKKGIVKTWRIDLQTEDVPDYLNDFAAKVQEKITIINN